MASRLFRRLSGDLVTINGQQIRFGHRMRGKAPGKARSLEQRLESLNWKDPNLYYRVDIGYKRPSLSRAKVTQTWIDEMRKRMNDPELEKKARNLDRTVPDLLSFYNKVQDRIYRLFKLAKMETAVFIDLEKSKEEWSKLSGPSQIRMIADHYEIFEHLFGEAYFTPIVPIEIQYSLGEDLSASVHRGNLMKPVETAQAPTIHYESAADSLWTLLFTTPDGSLVDAKNELCHWFIGNIPGNDLSKGDLLVDYMRPIPARGIGFCRYVFVLYKQEGRIDYSEYKKEQPCLRLVDRNWSTLEFYRKYQDLITPASLAFFQADWDSSLSEFYRNTLGTREPRFEYDFPQPHLRKQEWFPKGKPFNIYLDKYRDPKEINKEFLLKKMRNVHPFRPPPPPLRFPNAHPHDPDMPSWLRLEVKKERLGWGRINEIK